MRIKKFADCINLRKDVIAPMNLVEFCEVNKRENLLVEWDELRNDVAKEEVTYASHKRVWWRCAQGHFWESEVKDRVNGETGCPYCNGKKVLKGFNDLITINPTVAAEWNHERNSGLTPADVTAGSEKRVWWKCALGHEWQASIENRALKGNACPYCSGRKALAGFNDLQTLYPDVAGEWCEELNVDVRADEIRPGSGLKVWWKCSAGHTWQARVFSRTSKKGAGCPVCAGRRK